MNKAASRFLKKYSVAEFSTPVFAIYVVSVCTSIIRSSLLPTIPVFFPIFSFRKGIIGNRKNRYGMFFVKTGCRGWRPLSRKRRLFLTKSDRSLFPIRNNILRFINKRKPNPVLKVQEVQPERQNDELERIFMSIIFHSDYFDLQI